MSGIATTPEEVERYSKCTLLAASLRNEASSSQADAQNSILSCVEFLEENEFIRYLFIFSCLSVSVSVESLDLLSSIALPSLICHFLLSVSVYLSFIFKMFVSLCCFINGNFCHCISLVLRELMEFPMPSLFCMYIIAKTICLFSYEGPGMIYHICLLYSWYYWCYSLLLQENIIFVSPLFIYKGIC